MFMKWILKAWGYKLKFYDQGEIFSTQMNKSSQGIHIYSNLSIDFVTSCLKFNQAVSHKTVKVIHIETIVKMFDK